MHRFISRNGDLAVPNNHLQQRGSIDTRASLYLLSDDQSITRRCMVGWLQMRVVPLRQLQRDGAVPSASDRRRPHMQSELTCRILSAANMRNILHIISKQCWRRRASVSCARQAYKPQILEYICDIKNVICLMRKRSVSLADWQFIALNILFTSCWSLVYRRPVHSLGYYTGDVLSTIVHIRHVMCDVFSPDM